MSDNAELLVAADFLEENGMLAGAETLRGVVELRQQWQVVHTTAATRITNCRFTTLAASGMVPMEDSAISGGQPRRDAAGGCNDSERACGVASPAS